MASDRPTGDWRNQGGAKRPASDGGTSRRSWQPGGEAPKKAGGRARSPWKRRIAAAVVTLSLVGLAICLILWFLPPRYPELAIAGGNDGTSLALPENASGLQIGNELADLAAGGRDRPKISNTPPVSADATGVKIHIDDKPRNLVIYLTAHGGADAQGAYLLVAPPKPASAADVHKVRVSTILGHIAQARNGKNTLLIFDSTRIPTSWANGLIFNDFTRALIELEDVIRGVKGLAVICASNEDERSWLFEERKTSVFGYYFLEAIRGDGQEAGTRITAAAAFEGLKQNVENWSIANRGEKQTPILLPRDVGNERAQKIDLAAAPSGGYVSPRLLDSPAPNLKSLEDAWATADELRGRIPPPETNNPVRWREYLELLLRWERLHRVGADTGAIGTQVEHLAELLRTRASGGGLSCLSSALPAATVLGQPTPVQVVKAKQLIEKLVADKDGVTLKQLEAADKELKAIFEQAGPAPVEVHFVRMLHKYLIADGRVRETPAPRLLRKAIEVRVLAEEAAWRFGTRGQYPYAEYVFPWVAQRIEAGDKNRQLGQDLLFSPEQDDWKKAEKFLADAETDYKQAIEDAQQVVLALATRDRVLTQLPYYARWLASYRGDRPEAVAALARADRAARGARELSQLTIAPGTPLSNLQAKQATVAQDFEAVLSEFAANIKVLTTTNSENVSDWHSLDGVLTVPFIAANQRMQLLARLQKISKHREISRQQLHIGEPQVQPPQARLVAARNRQMAHAILGLPATDDANHPDWPQLYRAAGDKIGEDFCHTLPDQITALTGQARNILTLSDAGKHLADGAFLTRVIDPAAPVVKGVDLIADDQAFRRHEMLLWQAGRVTVEGWAAITSSAVKPEWYCRAVSGNLTKSASELIQKVAESVNQSTTLSPDQRKPWLADYDKELARPHVELQVNAERKLVVGDELQWQFPFSFSKKTNFGTVGFPISWIVPPSERYAVPVPGNGRQRVERELFAGEPVAKRDVVFKAPGNPKDEENRGELYTRVFYRGQVYEQKTELNRVGLPTREWVYTPPPGGKEDRAAFAIKADEQAVAGTVTILIDLTNSMNERISENSPQTRLEAAKLAVRKVLKDLPKGTRVTLAYFYGSVRTANDTPTFKVEPFGKPEKLDGVNWERLYRPFDNITEAYLREVGGSTPLAGAIEQVLLPSRRKDFWPEDFTGSPTLIVVTDGEDNWGSWRTFPSAYQNKIEPGKLAFEALRDADRDFHLHIVFFGMRARKVGEAQSEEDRAKEQFKVLTDVNQFNALKRTPAIIHAERDADGLAQYCTQALLPRFSFGINRIQGTVWPTLPTDGGIKISPALPRGNYQLWGNPGQESRQSLDLQPAARIMVEAQRKEDGTFQFLLPAYGLKVAEKHLIPLEKRKTPDGLYGAIPEITMGNPVDGVHQKSAWLKMVMCMEPSGDRKVATRLAAPRPLSEFVWFEVKDRLDKDADYLRIENRWHMWAPTWELTANRWDNAQVDPTTIRRPVITGYWLRNGFPASVGNFDVESRQLAESFRKAKQVYTVGTSEVKLLSLDAEYYDPKNSNVRGLAEGLYLTIRVKTSKIGDSSTPGERVFLSPAKWKGEDQPWVLSQHHAYYDAHGRYTARFGPISPNDPPESITFSLYSVDALKRESWDVTVRIPDGRLPDGKAAMQDLMQQPDKK